MPDARRRGSVFSTIESKENLIIHHITKNVWYGGEVKKKKTQMDRVVFFRDKALFVRLTAYMSLRELVALLDSETRVHRQLFFQWLDGNNAFASAVSSRYGARNRDDVRDAMCIVAMYYDYLRVSNDLHCRPALDKEKVIRDMTRAAAKVGHILSVRTAVALPMTHSITMMVNDALEHADVVQLLLPMMTKPIPELWIDDALENNYLATLDVLLKYTSVHDQAYQFVLDAVLYKCLRTKNFDAAGIVLRYYSLDEHWNPDMIRVHLINDKPDRAAFLIKYMSEDTLRAVRDEMNEDTEVWRIVDEEIQHRAFMDTKRLRAPIGLPVFSEDRALFFNQLLRRLTLQQLAYYLQAEDRESRVRFFHWMQDKTFADAVVAHYGAVDVNDVLQALVVHAEKKQYAALRSHLKNVRYVSLMDAINEYRVAVVEAHAQHEEELGWYVSFVTEKPGIARVLFATGRVRLIEYMGRRLNFIHYATTDVVVAIAPYLTHDVAHDIVADAIDGRQLGTLERVKVIALREVIPKNLLPALMDRAISQRSPKVVEGLLYDTRVDPLPYIESLVRLRRRELLAVFARSGRVEPDDILKYIEPTDALYNDVLQYFNMNTEQAEKRQKWREQINAALLF